MTLIQRVNRKIRFIYSKARDKILILPYEDKRKVILAYKKQFELNIFIETGTFLGDTVEQFRTHFKQIISFELSEELAEKAKQRFVDRLNVIIVKGDSGRLLPSYLREIKEPCLFWLDGHYSSEFFMGDQYMVTAKGEKNTPILNELKAILSHPVKQHIILIDDARCFTGSDDYPTIDQLKKLVSEFGKHLSVRVKGDIIRITPPN